MRAASYYGASQLENVSIKAGSGSTNQLPQINALGVLSISRVNDKILNDSHE